MERKILTICLVSMFLLTSLITITAESKQIENTNKTTTKDFSESNVDDRLYPHDYNILDELRNKSYTDLNKSNPNADNPSKLAKSVDKLKIVLRPPWYYKVSEDKEIYGLADCWKEDTQMDGENGRTTLHAWAGPGFGLCKLSVNLLHYEGFVPPKESNYYFTYTYHQEGKIKLESGSIIIGKSSARGGVNFYFYLKDRDNTIFSKSMTVEDHISIAGIGNGVYPYSKTKSYSNSAHLQKNRVYTFGANGKPWIGCDGYVECPGFADQWVTQAGLQKVQIEWENSPPNNPENLHPGDGDTGVSTTANLRWRCDDPDGKYDSLTYDVYFGTSSNPPKVCSGTSSTLYDLGRLLSEETYYWKILVKDSKGRTATSPIWRFTTRENGCCFPAGTKITMADGSYKNIEDIKTGEKVLSYNVEKDRFTSWRVKLLGNPIHPVMTINNGLIQTTVDHPFYVKKASGETGWAAYDKERAKKFITFKGELLAIEVGDHVYNSDGEWIEITDIDYDPEHVQTYNILSYFGTKTYFANDLLVYEEHPPHCITSWLINLFVKKFPLLEQVLRSNQFLNKLFDIN